MRVTNRDITHSESAEIESVEFRHHGVSEDTGALISPEYVVTLKDTRQSSRGLTMIMTQPEIDIFGAQMNAALQAHLEAANAAMVAHEEKQRAQNANPSLASTGASDSATGISAIGDQIDNPDAAFEAALNAKKTDSVN